MITKEDLDEDSIYHYHYEVEIHGINHIFDFLCTYDKNGDNKRIKQRSSSVIYFNIISKSPETRWNLTYFGLQERDFKYVTKLS